MLAVEASFGGLYVGKSEVGGTLGTHLLLPLTHTPTSSMMPLHDLHLQYCVLQFVVRSLSAEEIRQAVIIKDFHNGSIT